MATKRQGCHKGGSKRTYKQKGRKSASRCYQEFSRAKHQSGMVAGATGNWIQRSQLSTKIEQVYQAGFPG